MNLLTLRQARMTDIAAIDTLVARSYGRLLRADYPPSTMVLAVPRLSRANPGLIRSGRYFVIEGPATAGGAVPILGAGGYSLARGWAEMRHLAVDPDHLRRGIARRLVGHVLDEAAAAGARRIRCMSTLTARAFYATMGFSGTEAIDLTIAAGVEIRIVLMARSLPRG